MPCVSVETLFRALTRRATARAEAAPEPPVQHVPSATTEGNNVQGTIREATTHLEKPDPQVHHIQETTGQAIIFDKFDIQVYNLEDAEREDLETFNKMTLASLRDMYDEVPSFLLLVTPVAMWRCAIGVAQFFSTVRYRVGENGGVMEPQITTQEQVIQGCRLVLRDRVKLETLQLLPGFRFLVRKAIECVHAEHYEMMTKVRDAQEMQASTHLEKFQLQVYNLNETDKQNLENFNKKTVIELRVVYDKVPSFLLPVLPVTIWRCMCDVAEFIAEARLCVAIARGVMEPDLTTHDQVIEGCQLVLRNRVNLRKLERLPGFQSMLQTAIQLTDYYLYERMMTEGRAYLLRYTRQNTLKDTLDDFTDIEDNDEVLFDDDSDLEVL
eukprot:TRINITY_DN37597_c0_g1_i1.p1 TRINITY_DN37597_c0_g1~~TRINITY_DN37597_c0_g1_i1.p1  ORF type:complete len:412 (+),score=70.76 TRINITY_DN37597_c0_g1_i1:89-1237(+)